MAPSPPSPPPPDTVSPVTIGGGQQWQQWSGGATPLPADGWTEINIGGILPAAPERSDRVRPRRKLVAVGACAAVLAGGLATVRLARSSPAGSPTPTAAVERLVHALEQHDLLGAAETFPAYDRQIVADAVEQYLHAGASSGTTKVDLHALDGYTLAVTGLTTRTESVTERISLVTLSGGYYKATADLRQMYQMADLGAVADQLDESELLPSAEGDLATMEKPIQIATVRDGEGWHVSYGYTAAELIRREGGQPAPDPARRIAAVGAGSPEQAARSLLDAFASGDWRAAIELTPDGEADVLHDYGHLILDATKNQRVTAKITAFESHTTTVGSHTVVVPDRIEVTSDGYRLLATRAGSGCVEVTQVRAGDEQAPVKGCVDDVFDTFGRSAPTSSAKLAERLRPMFDDGGIVVVEQDGKWFVSPYRSMASLAVPAAVGVVAWLKSSFSTWADPDTEVWSDPAFDPAVDPAAEPAVDPVIEPAPSTTTADTSPTGRRAEAAQISLRSALAVVATVYTDRGSFVGLADAVRRDADPELFPAELRDAVSHGPAEISWTETGLSSPGDGLIMAALGNDGVCYLLGYSYVRDLEYLRYDAAVQPCRAQNVRGAWSQQAEIGWADAVNPAGIAPSTVPANPSSQAPTATVPVGAPATTTTSGPTQA